MTDMPGSRRSPLLAGRGLAVQWLFLLSLSAVLVVIFELAHLPAAFLIGPMLAAVCAGVQGATIAIPRPAFGVAQAVVGCMIAASLTADLVPAFLADWPILISATLATLAASSIVGWLISRWHILPGTVGIWGAAPGAASAMVLMAGAFGADQRLVAFMQYLRVMMVSFGAAMVARLWVGSTAGPEAIVWFPPLDWTALSATLAVAAAGAGFGAIARLPSPFFLGSLIVALVAKFTGLISFELPPWLLAVSYAIVGWAIGIRFTADTLRQVRVALVRVALSILALMAFCGMIAFLLAEFAGVDPLTAYLATSPGGMDSVAIIAAASRNVDISFVMTMQMLRFLIVLVLGPVAARYLAGKLRD